MLSIEFSHAEGGVGGKKRDTNKGSSDKGVLISCARCFFKSIFSMADSSDHWS